MSGEQLGHVMIVPPQVDHLEYVARVKRSRFSRCLVYTEAVCSCVILLLGVITVIISHSNHGYIQYEHLINKTTGERGKDAFHFRRGHFATPVWGGMIMVASSTMGLYSMLHPERKGPRLAFLILVIFASVASFITFMFNSLRSFALHYLWLHEWRKELKILSGVGGFYALKYLLGIVGFVAFVNLVCCICSSSLWCYHWCNCFNESSSYMQTGQLVYTKNSEGVTTMADALKQILDSSGNVILRPGGLSEIKLPVGQPKTDDLSQTDRMRDDFRYGKLED